MEYSWSKLLSDIPGALPVAALLFALISDLLLPDASVAIALPVSAVAALALTRVGSVWDNVLFDGLYSTQVGDSSAPWLLARHLSDGGWEGRLVHSERTFIVPPGADLHRMRKSAGVSYKEAERLAKQAGRWNDVRGRLEVSKFCRALPLPFLIAAPIALVEAGGWTAWGVVFAITGALGLVGFLHYRVEYMTALYEIAGGEMRDGRDAT